MPLQYNAATMSTGFADIDAQHRELIDQLNRLITQMQAGKGQEELAPLLDFLVDYSRRHFSHEEGCMARHQCPVATANRNAHRQFLDMLDDFRRQVATSGPTVSLVLKAQKELGEWIRMHIVRTDTRLRECVGAGAGG